ncbi:MAG: ribonuclease J, partial [Clostridia bacterium]|nr:ribonuclease J [Clostridia bacterium]
MNKQNNDAIYDDSVSNEALMKDVRKKLERKSTVEIDTVSIENIEKKVIKKLDQGNKSENKEPVQNTPKPKIIKENKYKKRTENNRMNRQSNIKTTSKDIISLEKFKKQSKVIAKGKEKLKIIPLGGLQEIGKNLTIFEYGNEIVIVDCGVAFPEDDMLGVDLVIPDITYLEKNASKIKGIVITHGHEDHIGSIPYFLKKINVPIYATKLTMGLIETKLEEHGLMRTSELYIVKATDVIKLVQFN